MSLTDADKLAGSAKGGRRWWLLLAFLLGTGCVWGGWSAWSYWRYRGAMDEIDADIIAGRYSIACRSLEELLSRTSDSNGRIGYLLGSCELARGRNQAADKAWAAVAPGSAFSQKALESRIHLLEESGRYAGAERLAHEAAQNPGYDGTALLVLLVPLYRDQGRLDEAERLIEDRWKYLNASGQGALEPAVKLVLEHVALGLHPTPVETSRAALERAAQRAPTTIEYGFGALTSRSVPGNTKRPSGGSTRAGKAVPTTCLSGVPDCASVSRPGASTWSPRP